MCGTMTSVQAASFRQDSAVRPDRLIIVGLDGVPFGLLADFAGRGVMPNIQRIIQTGIFRAMRSTVPEISSVAWSSIITGCNPAEHGIFGFVDLVPNSYKIRFPNFYELRSPPFWTLVGGKSVIINVPATYPVRTMNGVHISGFVSIDINRSVYPPSLIPELQKLGYRLDVDAEKAHKDMGLFLEDLDQTLAARIRAYEYLWGYTDWKVFMLVFTGTDRLMHFLWDAGEDHSHKYHSYFVEYFRKLDQVIGDVCSRLSQGDALILLSDHGFGRLEKDVYVNFLLAREGFLRFCGSEPSLTNIDYQTKAFALDPGRIFVNLQGKYPAGSVTAADKSRCVEELEQLFSALEFEGRKVIKHIYRKEQVYSGPLLADAPDIILIADKGFNLKGSLASNQLFARGPFTGKHTYDDAFLLINDPAFADNLPDDLSVINAGELIKTLTCQKP